MEETRDTGGTARSVFAGLTPTDVARAANEIAAGENRRRMRQGIMSTMPIVLAGAMTVTFNLTGPIETASATPKRPSVPKSSMSPADRAAHAAAQNAAAAAAQAAVPATYTVQRGDTVSAIAARFGVSTASVLAANGLGWKSLIFPGQVLKLSGAAASGGTSAPSAGRYTIVRGDTISGIAQRYGLTTAGLLAANSLSRTSVIYPGQTIVLSGSSIAITPVSNVTPNPAADPPSPPATSAPPPVINNSYTIKAGDTITAIAARFGVGIDALLGANGLTRASIIYA
ncbi:MAG: LysM peptidoglycan-binding domain-containing protein, partial [Pseudolysinimonas sp.]